MFSKKTTCWTRHDDILFEQALVMFPEETQDRWQKIAELLPGKSAMDIEEHYEALLYDMDEIDSGRIELPDYNDELADMPGWDFVMSQISCVSEKARIESDRRKGASWTEEEHKLFLYGLQKYGKGDWRSISRNIVLTKTPTQVASHAQKYFLRQKAGKKERKRSSIHDITTVNSNELPLQIFDTNWSPAANVSMHQIPPSTSMQQMNGQNPMHPDVSMQHAQDAYIDMDRGIWL